MLEVDLQSPENHPQTPKGGFKNVDNFVASMGGSMQLAVPFALCPAPCALRPEPFVSTSTSISASALTFIP